MHRLRLRRVLGLAYELRRLENVLAVVGGSLRKVIQR